MHKLFFIDIVKVYWSKVQIHYTWKLSVCVHNWLPLISVNTLWSLFSHVHIELFYLHVLLRHTNRWLDLEIFALARKMRIRPDGLASFSANIVPLTYGQEDLWQDTPRSTLSFNTDNVWYLFILINSCC